MGRLENLLSEFNSLDKLKRLFWEELNYDRVNKPVPVTDWDYAIAELPIIFAEGGSQEVGGFKVLYTKLRGDELRLMHERTIITQLLRDYPYALFVFSNEYEDTWHFVNVKIAVTRDTDENRRPQKRRLFRRLTIAPPYNHLHTAIKRIAILDLEEVSGRDLFGLSPLAIQQQHDTAFDVEAVTRDFFREYRRVFENAERSVTGVADEEARRLFTQKVFNRLMFIIFLEKKGWLTFNNSQDYVLALWKDYRDKREQGIQHNFYRDRLKPLFFAGLNNQEPDAEDVAELYKRIGEVPYLNGGLFESSEYDEKDSPVVIPDDALSVAISDIFYRFNFTVVESTPLDVEVAVDPEMLGKIFEELVTGRHESGSYYTPKTIVSYMTKETLKHHLRISCPNESDNAIELFVETQETKELADPRSILSALESVTVCDPACGSGAYLVGILQELEELRRSLFATHRIDHAKAYDRKLDIIQKNIYGVDIDPFAVNIARLRLWLSLIVEYEGDNPPPLPNLDFKIEIGDSIIGPDPSGGKQPDLFRTQTIKSFNDLKADYLVAHGKEKVQLREQIDQTRTEIEAWARLDKTYVEGFDWAVEFAEIFRDNNGGFDIVLANPPYIRQESLHLYQDSLVREYGDFYTRTADIFVYFYRRAVQLLKKNGVLCFITSNKWMRANYGQKLRQFLVENTSINSIIDFGDLPVFEAAAYPCIVIAAKRRPTDGSFLALNVDNLYVIDRLREEINSVAWLQPQNSLNTENWTLTHPAVLSLVKKILGKGKPLGQLIDGNFYYGLKTGFNEAFVIDEHVRADLVQADTRSSELIKPWLRGRDIKRWQIRFSNLYLIAIQSSTDADANHLWARVQNELEATKIFRDEYPAIYEHLSSFEDALRTRRDQGKFWWELRSCTYYAEFEKPKIIWPDIAKATEFAFDRSGAYGGNTLYIMPTDQLYLLAILNSIVTNFFYNQISVKIRGDYLRFIAQYIEQIPIPEISPSDQQKLEQLVRQLIDNSLPQEQVQYVENEINLIVYRLFDLTDNEVQLMHEELNWRESEIAVDAIESLKNLKGNI